MATLSASSNLSMLWKLLSHCMPPSVTHPPSGLGTWALSAQRGPDLLSLNKEGIVSCAGYWALHLAGSALARGLHDTVRNCLPTLREMCGGGGGRGDDGGGAAFYQKGTGNSAGPPPPPPTPDDSVTGLETNKSCQGGPLPGRIGRMAPELTSPSPPNHSSLLNWLVAWACIDVALWVCLGTLELAVERRSRRLCNAAYVVWTAALGLSLLLPLMAAQVREGRGRPVPAVARHGRPGERGAGSACPCCCPSWPPR